MWVSRKFSTSLGKILLLSQMPMEVGAQGKSWAFILLVVWHRIAPEGTGIWGKKKSKQILKIPVRLWTLVTMTLIEDNANLALTFCNDYHWNNPLLPTLLYLSNTSSWVRIALYPVRKQKPGFSNTVVPSGVSRKTGSLMHAGAALSVWWGARPDVQHVASSRQEAHTVAVWQAQWHWPAKGLACILIHTSES